jgi:hypothetical protein
MTESAEPTAVSTRIQLTPRERKFVESFLEHRSLEKIVMRSANVPFLYAWTTEECQRMWDTPHVRKAVESGIEQEARINALFVGQRSAHPQPPKAATAKQ